MARVVRLHWVTDTSAGLPRKDRRSCDYEAYIPDPLVGRGLSLEGPVAADVSESEAALVRFNLAVGALADSEALARLLLRTESVASSRIEGLEVGARRLLHADAERQLGEPSRDVTAAEVLGNIDAMLYAVESVGDGDLLSIDLLLEIHRRLLSGTRLESHGGRFRSEQNWIGGSAFNACSADYVPPPFEFVPDLVADLCAFCNEESLPAIAQAAMAHAQFETIHPFVDGNGRTGRALIHLILRRRGLAPRVVPPVSLILATLASDYVQALTAYRYEGEPSSQAAIEGLNRWVALFAGCCTRATSDAAGFERRMRGIQDMWRERLGSVRRNSTTDLLIDLLPGTPIVTVTGAASLLKRSFPATNKAFDQLLEAGVLHKITVGKRNRAFEATAVISAFSDLERQLASPEGDTLSSPPARPIPARSDREV